MLIDRQFEWMMYKNWHVMNRPCTSLLHSIPRSAIFWFVFSYQHICRCWRPRWTLALHRWCFLSSPHSWKTARSGCSLSRTPWRCWGFHQCWACNKLSFLHILLLSLRSLAQSCGKVRTMVPKTPPILGSYSPAQALPSLLQSPRQLQMCRTLIKFCL